eukprot:3435600-Rhodomonas_salina.18
MHSQRLAYNLLVAPYALSVPGSAYRAHRAIAALTKPPLAPMRSRTSPLLCTIGSSNCNTARCTSARSLRPPHTPRQCVAHQGPYAIAVRHVTNVIHFVLSAGHRIARA